MKKIYKYPKTQFTINNSEEGEPIETKLAKMIAEKEIPPQAFERIYTDKKDGVMPEYDIRTDRFEVAREAKDKLNEYYAQKAAKAAEKLGTETSQEGAE